MLMLFPFLATAAVFCADQPSHTVTKGQKAERTYKQSFARVQKAGLPNAVRIQPNLISGGHPTSQDGFRSLVELGVKTIVSVDGVRPDLDSASKVGIRYIHLPLGYRRISNQSAETLAHVILKFDGPIYIHCHHGKHRSPSATAVACVTAGLMTNDTALAVLETAGTGSNYKGLFQAVAEASPVATSKLLQLTPVLPAQADVGQVVELMTQMDKDMVQLKAMLQDPNKQFSATAISSLTEHATLLNDHFSEMLRRPATKKAGASFQSSLVTSQRTAIKLQRIFEQSTQSMLTRNQVTQASSLVSQISKQCQQCHHRFRDQSR